MSFLLPNQVILFNPWVDVIVPPAILVLVTRWREPKSLERIVSSTGMMMLGMRQLSGWTVQDGEAFLSALGDKGRELYTRYTSFRLSLLFTLVEALQVSLSLQRHGYNNSGVEYMLPCIFCFFNLLQDHCVAIFVGGQRRDDTLALVCSYVTRCKFASLMVYLLLAPTRFVEFGLIFFSFLKVFDRVVERISQYGGGGVDKQS